ncbi:MAG: 50S ribosomal protein L9 [Rhodobacter sp.]|nr:50S ribosomal protein L9 [Rhodobacter sp.]
MEVILLERVSKLGQMGEVVNVKPGYARNFLLPAKKALRASKANIEAFEAQKAQLEANNLETRKEAETLAGKLSDRRFTVIRSASDSGSLYGSVSPRDAAEAATAAGFTIDRKQVMLKVPIKELGLHDVIVSLHPEVEVSIQLNVARSEEEADLQATGRSVSGDYAEDDAEFDVSELFDDLDEPRNGDGLSAAVPEEVEEATDTADGPGIREE